MPQSDQGTLRESWLSFYKTTRYHIFRTAVHQGQFLFFEIFDLPGYNFCDERFVFPANAVIPVDVEDLPTEAIQRTNSLIGPRLTCPRDIDGSESVRPFPSVVQGIACQTLPEDNLGVCFGKPRLKQQARSRACRVFLPEH